MRKYFLLFLLVFALSVKGQDSLRAVKGHSPRKAMILSAVVPGAGQFYNKKYWKIPIVYGGGAALVYSTVFAHTNYQKFLKDFQTVSNPDTNISKTYTGVYTKDNLILLKDFYRRNRDLSIIGMAALYAANIIDAYVDAQLFNFDISDDISLNVSPLVAPSYQGIGLSFHFNTKKSFIQQPK